jgi:hypothetical protein
MTTTTTKDGNSALVHPVRRDYEQDFRNRLRVPLNHAVELSTVEASGFD